MPVLYLMLLKQYFKTYLLICINMLALYLDEILYWRENMLNKKVISILLSIFFTMLPSDIVVKSKTYNDKDNSVWQKKRICSEKSEKSDDNISKNRININPMSLTEELRYETVESNYEINKDFSIVMAAKVEYLYDNAADKPIEILGVGNPYVVFDGKAASYNWHGSIPNISWNKKSLRISITGQAFFTVDSIAAVCSDNIIFGGNIGGTTSYHTKTKTYVMNKTLNDL